MNSDPFGVSPATHRQHGRKLIRIEIGASRNRLIELRDYAFENLIEFAERITDVCRRNAQMRSSSHLDSPETGFAAKSPHH